MQGRPVSFCERLRSVLAVSAVLAVAACASPEPRVERPRHLLHLLLDVSREVGGEDELRAFREVAGAALQELERALPAPNRIRVFFFAGRVEPAVEFQGDRSATSEVLQALDRNPAGPLAPLMARQERHRTDILGAIETIKRQIGLGRVASGSMEWPTVLLLSNGIHDPSGKDQSRNACRPSMWLNPGEIERLQALLASEPLRVVLLHTPCGFAGAEPVYGLAQLWAAAASSSSSLRVLQASRPRGNLRSAIREALSELEPDVSLSASELNTRGNQRMTWSLRVDGRVDAELRFCQVGARLGLRDLNYGDEVWLVGDGDRRGCTSRTLARNTRRIDLSFDVSFGRRATSEAPGVVRLHAFRSPVEEPRGAALMVYPDELRLEFRYAPPPPPLVWFVEEVGLFGLAALCFGILWVLVAIFHRRCGLLSYGWSVTAEAADPLGKPLRSLRLRPQPLLGYRLRPAALGLSSPESTVDVHLWPLHREQCAFWVQGDVGARLLGRWTGSPRRPAELDRLRCSRGLEYFEASGHLCGRIVVSWEPGGSASGVWRALLSRTSLGRFLRWGWLSATWVGTLGTVLILEWYGWRYYWADYPLWTLVASVLVAGAVKAGVQVFRVEPLERLLSWAHVLEACKRLVSWVSKICL